MTIGKIRGRWPERRIPLRHEDMWVSTTPLADGGIHVRLENAQCMAFWMEFEIAVPVPVLPGQVEPSGGGGETCTG